MFHIWKLIFLNSIVFLSFFNTLFVWKRNQSKIKQKIKPPLSPLPRGVEQRLPYFTMPFFTVEEGRGSWRSWRKRSMQISWQDFSVKGVSIRELSDSRGRWSHSGDLYLRKGYDMKFSVIDFLLRRFFSVSMMWWYFLEIVLKRWKTVEKTQKKYTIVIRHRATFSISVRSTSRSFQHFFEQ